MKWRVLKAGGLVVSDANISEKDKKHVSQWVTLLYDVHTKWMKVEIREERGILLPKMSLILKPCSVNIEFFGTMPHFIVSLHSKIVSSITLEFNPETFDPAADLVELLEWQTLFRSAINPNINYAVSICHTSGDVAALLTVSLHCIQLSSTEGSQNSKPASSLTNLIANTIDGVTLTVEDTLQLKFNRQVFVLRTSRLIELYQHITQHHSERKGSGSVCSGDYNIANTDYVNLRRESRHLLVAPEDAEDVYVPYEEVPTWSTEYENNNLDEDSYGYVMRSPKVSPVSSPRSDSSPRPGFSPMPSRKLPSMDNGRMPSRTILPSLIPPVPSYNGKPESRTPPKPEPRTPPKPESRTPPKPRNARELLNALKYDVEKLDGEQLYSSVQRKPKHSISASSIGIGGLSAEDEELPTSHNITERPGSFPNSRTSRTVSNPNILDHIEDNNEDILYETVYAVNSQARGRSFSSPGTEGSGVPTRKSIRVTAVKVSTITMQKLDRMLNLRTKKYLENKL